MVENKSLAFFEVASNKSRPTSHWIQMKRPENSSQKLEAFKSGAFYRRRMTKLLEQLCSPKAEQSNIKSSVNNIVPDHYLCIFGSLH